jgi:hypothetical protein
MRFLTDHYIAARVCVCVCVRRCALMVSDAIGMALNSHALWLLWCGVAFCGAAVFAVYVACVIVVVRNSGGHGRLSQR